MVIQNIRQRTKHLDKKEKAEYIAEYYWHYFLIIAILFTLSILVVYHLAVGRQKPAFACIIVNQSVDYERDAALAKKISDTLSLPYKKVRVDSQYRISYPGHVEKDAIESNYEKFFFGWAEGELDAVILPKRFLSYIRELGGETLGGEVPLSETELGSWIALEGGEDYYLIVPETTEHQKRAEQFLEGVRT